MPKRLTDEPAFPSVPASGNWGIAVPGMSLRDYFAAQAATGRTGQVAGPDWEKVADVIAQQAYLIADALLKARED